MKLHNCGACWWRLKTNKQTQPWSCKKVNRAGFIDCMCAFCTIHYLVHAAMGPLAPLAAGSGPARCQGEQKIGEHLDSGMTLKFVWLQWPVLSSGSGWKYERVWPSACSGRTCVLQAVWGKRPAGLGIAHTHIHTQWHATDMVQPLAIAVISTMDTSIACDAERPSLSDTTLVSYQSRFNGWVFGGCVFKITHICIKKLTLCAE